MRGNGDIPNTLELVWSIVVHIYALVALLVDINELDALVALLVDISWY